MVNRAVACVRSRGKRGKEREIASSKRWERVEFRGGEEGRRKEHRGIKREHIPRKKEEHDGSVVKQHRRVGSGLSRLLTPRSAKKERA